MDRTVSSLSIRAAVTMRGRCGRWLASLLALTMVSHPAWASATPEEDASLISTSDAPATQNAPHYLKLSNDEGESWISTSFRTFDNEALTLDFSLPPGASQASLREFGSSDVELKALMRNCMASGDCQQAVFDRQTTRYYREHALRLRNTPDRGTQLYVDVAQVVERNRDRVLPVVAALRRVADARGYDQQWMITAAVALVQSGLAYRKPEGLEDGREIFGFYPPLRALERGYGDCDTKAALLAAILQNLTDAPLIGVHVPQHYLLGIAATPQADQAWLRYGGRTYVLVETAGPGKLPPGNIARHTQAALARGEDVRIDPMF